MASKHVPKTTCNKTISNESQETTQSQQCPPDQQYTPLQRLTMTPSLSVTLDDEKGQQSHATRDIYRLESNVLW